MRDLVVGIGLVMVIEGLLWAAFPGMATKLLETAASTREQSLRLTGIVVGALGVVVVWLARG